MPFIFVFIFLVPVYFWEGGEGGLRNGRRGGVDLLKSVQPSSPSLRIACPKSVPLDAACSPIHIDFASKFHYLPSTPPTPSTPPCACAPLSKKMEPFVETSSFTYDVSNGL